MLIIQEVVQSQLVDKQEKVITLCLDAVDRIRKYAKGAFLFDKPYYRMYYTFNNDFHRSDNDTVEEIPETSNDTDSNEIPPETDN